MPYKTGIRLLALARNPANGFPARLLGFLQDTNGAVAFEYVLILGAVSVAGIAAMVAAPNLMTGLVSATCDAMDPIVLPLGTVIC